ncbi:hypothetical protein JAAARDRAFT_557124 [Jaapia argillacea MUCL 33604]|uniref:Uncharacterized protein n=1 Tax=Jaapia argillacea MUCL 33604 TaxID=933084 RepID=A0A067Q0Q2_9AGAM|nr:hypothetical protein JAAARDRAFT_557124 [Jaapia argillacea MUCL 33604]
MNFNSNDNLILAAPRPVRLPTFNRPVARYVSAPPESDESGEKIMSENKIDLFLDSAASEPISPRTTSRLSSEALEEFLSILRPSSLFTPSSPIFRARNHSTTISLPSLPFQRSPRAFHEISNSPSPVALGDEERSILSGLKSSQLLLSDKENAVKETDGDGPPPRRLGGILSSPVSRWHTRNPFQRQPSYEPPLGLIRSASTSSARAVSPAMIPLPSPTPEELALP